MSFVACHKSFFSDVLNYSVYSVRPKNNPLESDDSLIDGSFESHDLSRPLVLFFLSFCFG